MNDLVGRSPDPDLNRRGQVQGPQVAKAQPKSRQGRIQIRADCGRERDDPPSPPAQKAQGPQRHLRGRQRKTCNLHQPRSPEGGAHASASGGEPCEIASLRSSQPEAAPGCTCPVC